MFTLIAPDVNNPSAHLALRLFTIAIGIISVGLYLWKNAWGSYVYVFQAEDGTAWFHNRLPVRNGDTWIAVDQKTRKTVALKPGSIIARIPYGGWLRRPHLMQTSSVYLLDVPSWILTSADLETAQISRREGKFGHIMPWPAAMAFLERFADCPSAEIDKGGKSFLFGNVELLSTMVLTDISTLRKREEHDTRTNQALMKKDLELRRAEFRHQGMRIALETVVAGVGEPVGGAKNSKHAQLVREFLTQTLSNDNAYAIENPSNFQHERAGEDELRKVRTSSWDTYKQRIFKMKEPVAKPKSGAMLYHAGSVGTRN